MQSTPASTYAWNVTPAANATLSSDTAQNTTVTFSQPGSYTLCLSVTFANACSGCDAIDSCITIVVLDTITGIESVSTVYNCDVRYANMSDGSVRFELPSQGTLTVYDALGRSLRRLRTTAGESYVMPVANSGVLLYRFVDVHGNVCSNKVAVLK